MGAERRALEILEIPLFPYGAAETFGAASQVTCGLHYSLVRPVKGGWISLGKLLTPSPVLQQYWETSFWLYYVQIFVFYVFS